MSGSRRASARERRVDALELVLAGGEAGVQADDALGEDEPGVELGEVDRLGQVVVGAGGHRPAQRRRVVERGEQDDVGVRAVVGPDAAHEAGAVEAGHHPVAQDDVGAGVGEGRPGRLAVGRDGHLVPGSDEDHLQQLARELVVVGDEDPHAAAPSRAPTAAPTASRSGADERGVPGLDAAAELDDADRADVGGAAAQGVGGRAPGRVVLGRVEGLEVAGRAGQEEADDVRDERLVPELLAQAVQRGGVERRPLGTPGDPRRRGRRGRASGRPGASRPGASGAAASEPGASAAGPEPATAATPQADRTASSAGTRSGLVR